ncbi:MAG: type II secretion system F family protein [Pseudomonadota bacterium]
MPNYRYRAYTHSGKLEDGLVEAQNEQACLDILDGKGLYPFEVHEDYSNSLSTPWWQRDLFSGASKISLQNLALFTRELATLFKAGLPIDETLRIVAAQVSGRHMKSFCKALLDDVIAGHSLSQAFANQGEAVPHYYTSLVRAGEARGALDDVFEQLANFIEKSENIRAKIRSALVYPMILIGVAFAALGLIVTVLIPSLAPIFTDAGAPMPTIIAVVLTLQDFFSNNWLVTVIALLSVCVFLVIFLRKENVKYKRDQILLRIPLISTFITKRETARFSRTLSVLLTNGVPLLKALEIVSHIMSNRVFIRTQQAVIEDIKKGQSLHHTLTQTEIFPDLAVRLIKVGEESGKLEEMLLHTAQIFETQVQRSIDRYMSLLTPALTLFIGLSVGGLIMSVMSAILSINELAL